MLVASDECYAEFTWAGRPRSILEHGLDGVLAVHSISKRSNLAGVRAGFYAGDPEVVAFLRSCASTPGLWCPARSRRRSRSPTATTSTSSASAPSTLHDCNCSSDALGPFGVNAPMPDGSFYLGARRRDSTAGISPPLLAETSGLIVSPGELYGDAGAHFVRIAIVQPDDRLALAASRLRASLYDRYAVRMAISRRESTTGSNTSPK